MRLNKSSWARTAALTTALAIIGGMTTAQIASAQQTPPVALEQARSGEDGTSGAGATSGGFSTGNAKRDKSGNGSSSTASAGSAGDTGGTDTAAPAEELPPNADVLAALGVLDDAQTYDLDILTGLNIPLELLPPPPAEDAPAPPEDINTGGGGDASSVSTEPGSGSAPAGGSTDTTAGDGTGATDSGEAKHDRPHHNQTDGTTTDSGSGTSTDGGTDTSSDTGQ